MEEGRRFAECHPGGHFNVSERTEELEETIRDERCQRRAGSSRPYFAVGRRRWLAHAPLGGFDHYQMPGGVLLTAVAFRLAGQRCSKAVGLESPKQI